MGEVACLKLKEFLLQKISSYCISEAWATTTITVYYVKM